MRRIICIMILFCIVFTSGCSQQEKYSILVSLVAGNDIRGANIRTNVSWALGIGTFQDRRAKQQVTMEVFGEEMSGEYYGSSYCSGAKTHVQHSYFCGLRRTFDISDDGLIRGYYNGYAEDGDLEQMLSEAECVAIVRDLFSQLQNPDDYTMSVTEGEDGDEYTVAFEKYVNGIKCKDHADFRIRRNGKLISLITAKLGEMPAQVDDFPFDIEVVDQQVYGWLDKKYEKAKEEYDTVRYEKDDYKLTFDARGEYLLICSVDIECRRKLEKGYERASDLISLWILPQSNCRYYIGIGFAVIAIAVPTTLLILRAKRRRAKNN